MRTAADFDKLYMTSDPWGSKQIRFRERVLRRLIEPFVAGKSMLELGCGEGHLTASVFRNARSIDAIDISDIAIERARKLCLPNANFISADFVNIALLGYDVITAIECLYYLSYEEREAVLSRVSSEHRGKILIISAPIIGESAHQKYFTHEEIMGLLDRHRIGVRSFHNLYVKEGRSRLANLARSVFLRAPFTDLSLDYLPDWMIYQRCYVGRVADS
jgi:2-polyprenyl-3-methyl-5-hydroxy-6-metoxy-1,4-benzoquinol methylase